MLQVKNLTLTQAKDRRVLIQNLSFSLTKGQHMAVIGAEGNGKSSLLKLIHDPASVEAYLQWTGDFTYSPYRLGYLAQEIPPDLLGMPIRDWFAEDIANRDLYKIAAELNLPTELLFEDRVLGSCSGGEQIKLRLLKLLLQEPDILLLDEPGNDLDLEALAWLENFLNASPQAILYISHDEMLLDRTAHAILHIEQIWRRTEPRSTLARTGFSEYMERFGQNILRQNHLAAQEEKAYKQKMHRFNELQNKIHHDLNAVSRQDPATGRLLKKKMQSVKSMGRRFEREHENQTQRTDREEEMDFFLEDLPGVPQDKEILRLEIADLRAGDKTLASNLELTVKGPEKIGITGPNGSGKTTLLRRILLELQDRRDIRVFYLPQSPDALFGEAQTPLDFLVPLGEPELLQEASNLLGSMQFAREEVEHSISELSGGQKMKLAFADLRLKEANVLLLDEPTRHLSPLTNPVFRESLRLFEGTIISVSHDRLYLRDVCTRVLRLTPQGLREEDPHLYRTD